MLTLNKLRNPSINVKPDWKQRQLDFELETSGYHAMASLTHLINNYENQY